MCEMLPEDETRAVVPVGMRDVMRVELELDAVAGEKRRVLKLAVVLEMCQHSPESSGIQFEIVFPVGSLKNPLFGSTPTYRRGPSLNVDT